jgi:hypothetical protein
MSDRIWVRALFAVVIGLGVAAGLARADDVPAEKEGCHPFRNLFRKPVECADKFKCAVKEDTLSCNSWRTEARFVFGSCKEFFGDPCPERAFGHGDGKGGCGCK